MIELIGPPAKTARRDLEMYRLHGVLMTSTYRCWHSSGARRVPVLLCPEHFDDQS